MPAIKYPLIICEICGLPDGVRKIPDLEKICDCKGKLCRAHCAVGHGTHPRAEQPEPYHTEFIEWEAGKGEQDGRKRTLERRQAGGFQQIRGPVKE